MRHLSLALAFFIFFTVISCNKDVKSLDQPQTVEVQAETDTSQVQQTEAEFDSFGFRVDTLQTNNYTVKRNESFYLILDKFEFSAQEIYNITQKAKKVANVRYLKPGQSYRTYSSLNSEDITRLVWQPNPVDYVVFEWQDSLNIYKSSKSITTTVETASATVTTSLYEAMQHEGINQLVAHKLSEIYAWQIDFYRLRKGDDFKVLYEKKYIEGEEYGVGDILAAEFEHRGKTYHAYKFESENVSGYFDEKGNSLQKALLKVPFKYSQRISSGFSTSRFHPVLKKRRPHYGVDYAAPYGTPVLAVGDGTVTEAQYRGANGNIVKIRHNSTYKTAYLHLKGFARGVRRGAKVEQGQVIGYVGNTGRVTGTHLDYRVYKNGKPVNPVTLELPASESVPQSDMQLFEQLKDELNKKLDQTDLPEPMITDINNGLPGGGKNSSKASHTTR